MTRILAGADDMDGITPGSVDGVDDVDSWGVK